MAPSPLIRDARRTDGPALRALSRRALEGSGGAVSDPRWDHDLLDVETAYTRAGGAFLVATVRDRPVAMGGLRALGPHRGELVRMRVAPEWRRRGLARRILAALEAHALGGGVREVVLETTVAQRPARRLYERAGYRPVRSRRRRIGDQVFDVVEFAKALEPRGAATHRRP